jgi:hypothetical protein
MSVPAAGVARVPRHYASGTRFELKVIKDLQLHGWVTVRAAGSKGAGKVDIIAVHEPLYGIPAGIGWARLCGHLWIQCKTSGTLGPDEWNRVRECALWAGAVPILASNGPSGRGIVYEQLDGDRVRHSREYRKSLYDMSAWPKVEV